MENRTLEINLQYARDLNKVNLITKMDIYAVVSISGGGKNSKQKTRTPVDQDGDANPTWNFPMKFTVDEAALQMNRLTLDFKLICERALGDKDVGEVHVPIKELLDSAANGGANGKQFVSYQVRKPSGKPKGQLSFSYKFSEKPVGTAAAPPYGAAMASAPPPGKVGDKPVMAYPAGSSSGYPPPGAYGAAMASAPPPGKVGDEPVMAHPAGSSSGYPPPGAYPPPATYHAAEGSGHYPPPAPYAAPEGSGHYPPPPVGYPQAGGASAPVGYGYPPPPSGYGYPPPPPPGYGYPPQPGYGYPPPPPVVQQTPKKNKFGLGLGAGLLGGALGGLLIGDMISDATDFDCGGFDF